MADGSVGVDYIVTVCVCMQWRDLSFACLALEDNHTNASLTHAYRYATTFGLVPHCPSPSRKRTGTTPATTRSSAYTSSLAARMCAAMYPGASQARKDADGQGCHSIKEADPRLVGKEWGEPAQQQSDRAGRLRRTRISCGRRSALTYYRCPALYCSGKAVSCAASQVAHACVQLLIVFAILARSGSQTYHSDSLDSRAGKHCS